MKKIYYLMQMIGPVALLFSACVEIAEDIWGELLGFEIHHAVFIFALGHIISVINDIVSDAQTVSQGLKLN